MYATCTGYNLSIYQIYLSIGNTRVFGRAHPAKTSSPHSPAMTNMEKSGAGDGHRTESVPYRVRLHIILAHLVHCFRFSDQLASHLGFDTEATVRRYRTCCKLLYIFNVIQMIRIILLNLVSYADKQCQITVVTYVTRHSHTDMPPTPGTVSGAIVRHVCGVMLQCHGFNTKLSCKLPLFMLKPPPPQQTNHRLVPRAIGAPDEGCSTGPERAQRIRYKGRKESLT